MLPHGQELSQRVDELVGRWVMFVGIAVVRIPHGLDASEVLSDIGPLVAFRLCCCMSLECIHDLFLSLARFLARLLSAIDLFSHRHECEGQRRGSNSGGH